MAGVPAAAILATGGYLLGRTKKFRVALVIGSAVAGRGLPTSLSALAQLGLRYLATAPEPSRVRVAIRDQLWVAGRDAGIAVAGHRMDVLTDQLAARLELLEVPAGPGPLPIGTFGDPAPRETADYGGGRSSTTEHVIEGAPV